MPYLTNSECVNRFAADRVPIYETYLCAGGKAGLRRHDTCSGERTYRNGRSRVLNLSPPSGDSGGPIQSFGSVNNKPRVILYGVVSIGVKCLDNDVNYPGIYTNVAYYLDWILDKLTD